MKKVLFCSTLLLVFLAVSCALGESTPIDDFVYVARKGEVAIRSYNGIAETVVIPETINGSTVTTITKEAFKGNKTVKKIILPETITTLSDYAFAECSSLMEINIPEKVTVIPRACFNECSALASVRLPAGITEISNYAFYNCKALNTINFPKEKVPSLRIGYAAFNNTALAGVLELNAETLTLSTSFQECKFTHVILNTSKLVTSVWDQGMYFDDGCFTCDGLVLYLPPESTVSGNTVLIGSAVKDLTVFAPDDGTLFEKQDFSDAKNIFVYARPGTKALELAEEQWYPTNSDQYGKKAAEVLALVAPEPDEPKVENESAAVSATLQEGISPMDALIVMAAIAQTKGETIDFDLSSVNEADVSMDTEHFHLIAHKGQAGKTDSVTLSTGYLDYDLARKMGSMFSAILSHLGGLTRDDQLTVLSSIDMTAFDRMEPSTQTLVYNGYKIITQVSPDDDYCYRFTLALPSAAQPADGASAAMTDSEEALAILRAMNVDTSAAFTFTETTDPNKLLGQPNQYHSKVNFALTSLDPNAKENADLSVDQGGAIEVFSTTADAINRQQLVLSRMETYFSYTDYTFLYGHALLRLSSNLRPEEVGELVTVFMKACDANATSAAAKNEAASTDNAAAKATPEATAELEAEAEPTVTSEPTAEPAV